MNTIKSAAWTVFAVCVAAQVANETYKYFKREGWFNR